MADQNTPTINNKRISKTSSFLRNWPIARRISITAILSILTIIFIIAVIAINARTVYGSLDKLINDTAQEIQLFGNLNSSIQILLSRTREYAFLKQTATLNEIDDTISEINESLLNLMQSGEAVEEEDEGNIESQKLHDLEASVSELEAQVSTITNLARSGSTTEILIALDNLEQQEEQLTSLLNEFNADLQSEYDTITSSIQNQIFTTITTMAIGLIIFLLINIGLSHVNASTIITPLGSLLETSRRIADGDINAEADESGKDEISILASAFNRMNARQREALFSEAQTAQNLHQTLEQIQASTQVAQAVASILDPDKLIDQVVNLIRQAFDLYYVGVFIVDERNEWAILRAGTGSAGRAMLERNHRIKIGEGMIGWSIANAQARVALEVEADDVRLATSELPETRSELALPLRSRGRVVGAFTVQDSKPRAFDEQRIAVLQTMADQVAVALDNARLFAESQAALEASRRAFGQISQEAWNQFLNAATEIDYLATPQNESRIQSGEWPAEMAETYQVGDVTRYGEREVYIPIRLRDQTLGVVRLRKREESGPWSTEEIELMDTLVDQLETALETARLYNDTQRQAARVRLTQDITDKLHRSLDMDALMQTLLQEISSALDATGAFVQLSTPAQLSDSANSPRIRSAN